MTKLIINAILCYGASVLIASAAIFAVIYFFKKTKRRLSVLHTLLGALSFIAVIITMFLLMMYAFSENSTAYISALMPIGVYKITIAVLFFFAVGLLRYFAVNALYFSRGKEDNGMSFMAGYGLAGASVAALYCLFMFMYVSYSAVTDKFVALTEGQALMFESGAGIAVFTPFVSHIFVIIIFAVYTALTLIIAEFMDQHAKLPYRKRSTFLMYIITNTCEILMTCVILFASSKVSELTISIVCAVIAVLAALALTMLYKYKEELPYSKQFD